MQHRIQLGKAPPKMTHPTTVGRSLADDIINRVEGLVEEAEQARKPLEIDPYRGQLFELFVMADAADFLQQGVEPDLTADGLCRALSERWRLADAARDSFEQQTRLEGKDLVRMRMLWAVMRMWMEWTYAWQRWREFH